MKFWMEFRAKPNHGPFRFVAGGDIMTQDSSCTAMVAKMAQTLAPQQH
jgi:hypothetical protein